jgi:hypothetical protein
MFNSLYEPQLEDSPESQQWMQGRQNSGNYENYNQNSYQNYQWNHQFQQPSGSDNHNFYHNTTFLNQGSKPQFNQPRPPYITPAVIKFIQ